MSTAPARRVPAVDPDAGIRRLRIGHALLAVAHAVQAAVVLALSNDFSLPVTGTFLDGPPGTAPLPPDTLVDLPVGPAVAAFLALAALDHALVAAPGVHGWYAMRLRRGEGPVRWLEYSVSASLMIVLIAMLTGVSDVGALVAIAGANAAMILFGWLMERTNRPGTGDRVDWLPFLFGSLIGAVPWVVVTISVVGSASRGEGPPAFVYGIIASLAVLFFSFAVNQALQFARVGPWRRPLTAEWGYIVLSLAAKSLLAWQVFANTLVL
jgi:hypothetical protein